MLLNKEELGFNFDEETVQLLDAIMTNIAQDDELKEEFKKLRFIKTLSNNYNNKKGPIQQLLEKVAKIERERFESNLDLARVISDVEHIAVVLARHLPADAQESLESIHGISKKHKYYTFKE